MKSHSLLLMSAALCGGGLSPIATAQNSPATPTAPIITAPTGATSKRLPIRMNNVPASLMAWWIDPARQSEPFQVQRSRNTRENNPLLAGTANAKPAVADLAGIERIVAIDTQNTLLVYGTPEATAALERLVVFLDKPQGQVEVTAQLLAIAPQDVKTLGIEFSSDPKKRYRAFDLSAESLQQLNQWKQNRKVSVIAEPRVSAINKMTAAFGLGNGRELHVDIRARANEESNSINLTGKSGIDLVSSSDVTFTFTPTLQTDNSVALELAFARMSVLKTLPVPSSTATSLPRETIIFRRLEEGALINATVKDGQTIALTGYTANFLGNANIKKLNPNAKILVLITTRIVRRAENNLKTISLTR